MINKIPFFLSSSFFSSFVAIICKNMVIAIKSNILILKSVVKINGLMIAPKPINKHKFTILDPVIFPNSKSVSFRLAEIIPVMISGSAVPTAMIVIPIKLSDNPNFPAMDTALSTIKSAPNFSPNKPTII